MELAFTFAKNATKPNPFANHTTTDHKEGEQLEDRRSVGASSCNSRRNASKGPILDVYDDDVSLAVLFGSNGNSYTGST